MKSMTGFGSSEYKDENLEVWTEIKTINHRYKDFNIKLPRRYSILEERIRALISKEVTRGRIDVFIKIENIKTQSHNISYNKELARNYFNVLNEIKEDFDELNSEINLLTVARFPNVIEEKEEEEDIEKLWDCIKKSLIDATNMLSQSRVKEGQMLKKDFVQRIKKVEKECDKIDKMSKKLPKEYYNQLLSNLEKYELGNIEENRIMTEIAIFAEKINITEEIIRLKSHLKSFKEIISLNEPIGRKLDFLLQEINREANTIASKSNSSVISSMSVEIKSELEKIREQVQNIE